MKCQICRRRKGMDSHLDEDSIGLLCAKCHFKLVLLFRLLIQAAATMRRVNKGLALRMVKALFTLGGR